MNLTEENRQSAIRIFQLTDGPRPADNIYGEQPYSSPGSDRIAVRFYPADGQDGELAVLDLESGESHTVITGKPRFPAFHGWGDHLYDQEDVGGELLLRRWDWDTLARQDIVKLPRTEGRLSYGTVSSDASHYAVSVVRPDETRTVLHVDLGSGDTRTLADARSVDHPGGEGRAYHFKHEQFSRDGMNRVLIQANVIPEVQEVHLGTLEPGSTGMTRLACDQPWTPRPTGHEAWIGTTSRIFFSTAYDTQKRTNLFTVEVGVAAPEVVVETEKRFGHVSVSRCGSFWIADATAEEGVPIYAGRLGSGSMRQVIISRTVHDGQQWSHTHPYLTADNRWLIFTSTRAGQPQVFGAQIPDDFWQSL